VILGKSTAYRRTLRSKNSVRGAWKVSTEVAREIVKVGLSQIPTTGLERLLKTLEATPDVIVLSGEIVAGEHM